MDVARPGNLPLELSSFVGREREIAEVGRLLAGTRLLTLTGSGGCGKTRLALKVAGNLAKNYEEGAWWVGLAPLADPGLAPKAVASALGVSEHPALTPAEALSEHLGSSNLLLVLDNCEHVVAECAELADVLLRACPDLRILATSREALGIAGETTWPVPSLSLPAVRSRTLEELTGYEAIRLFVERAAAVAPGFAPTKSNASALLQVCRELEGIPLAIELAAARVRVLAVEQIAERLDDRFALLTAGSRTSSPRQKTLRATMDWSHELLSEKEKALFRRLSVFAGGFPLEAAEEVCSGVGVERCEVLDLLSRLVEKSLVVMGDRDARARYRLLETIRQYASEKLRTSGESEAVGRRHADFFLALAEEAELGMAGPNQAVWMGRLEEEHDNVRVALGWLGEEGEAERGLRLAAALLRFWWFRGHLVEGRTRLEGLLDLCPVAPIRDEVRAKAMYSLGMLIAYAADDWDVARSRMEEGLEIYRRLGDETHIAAILQNLGRVYTELGQPAARSILDESLEIGRRSDNKPGIALSLFLLGTMHFRGGELPRARAKLEESIEMFRRLDDRFWINACQCFLGYIDCDEGAYAEARSRFVETNEVSPMAQFPWGATYTLEGFARLAAARGQAARALRLAGATDALRRTFGVAVGPTLQAAFERSLEPAWQALGEEDGKAAWKEGRAMSLDEVIAFALEEPDAKLSPPSDGVLSAREVEVLSLVAAGLTDVQVAERLYLSRHTVGHHLSSVYRKLGVQGRAAAVHLAGEMGLIQRVGTT